MLAQGPRIRTASAVLACALLALIAACEPASSSDNAIRTDSAGVLLVEYPDLPPIEASRIAIAAEPELVLGEGDALPDPDYEFFRITGVVQLEDGTLVVANQGSLELRFYGADGQFLRAVGREGEGPGEFRNLWDLWLVGGDTLVTWDLAVRRLQYFSPEGAFVRAASMPQAPFEEFVSGRAGESFGMPSMPQALLEQGQVVVFLGSPWTPTDGLPERQPLLVALHRIDEGRWDAVRVVPGEERIISYNNVMSSSTYTFPAYPVADGAGATLAVADVARFRVELFDPDGRPVSIISAAVSAIPVTAEVIEAQVGVQLDYVDGGAPDDYADRIRTAFTASHAPSLPVIRMVFVDADERVWVERYDVPGSGSRWEVFEGDGTWIGRVEMPEGFARERHAQLAPGFSIRSGRLAGVWRDPDTGVETVRVYRVIESGS